MIQQIPVPDHLRMVWINQPQRSDAVLDPFEIAICRAAFGCVVSLNTQSTKPTSTELEEGNIKTDPTQEGAIAQGRSSNISPIGKDPIGIPLSRNNAERWMR